MLTLEEFIKALQEVADNGQAKYTINFVDCIIRRGIRQDRVEWIEDVSGARQLNNVAFNFRLIKPPETDVSL